MNTNTALAHAELLIVQMMRSLQLQWLWNYGECEQACGQGLHAYACAIYGVHYSMSI